jgi:O-acetylhomoserine/O-acetylserine sulfhydrylase-like pyridoxal-dependent enzyme
LILLLAVVAMSALAQQPEAEWNEVPPQTNLMEYELTGNPKTDVIDFPKTMVIRG